jgi:hypothetical protein
MLQAGLGLIVTVPDAGAALQPLNDATVQVYVVVDAGETDIEELVAPLLHA